MGLVVGPSEEEVFGGGGDGTREEGEEWSVGYVEGGEEGEGVGWVALGAEDWGCRVSCELGVVGGCRGEERRTVPGRVVAAET